MKKIFLLVLAMLISIALLGCQPPGSEPQVAATTLPVYEFTAWLCQNTDISVSRLITENVSCLHDYTLHVTQMRTIESAEAIILSGAGLETFLDDALEPAKASIDASAGIPLFAGGDSHIHEHGSGHDHDHDPHIWLSPANARKMARNICSGLVRMFPEYSDTFERNMATLSEKFDALDTYGEKALSNLSCRNMITFHDGFAYFADSYDLTILHALEEESGSEAAASELIEIIQTVKGYDLPAIFTETNGSDSAASIIAAETGVKIYTLDMAMSGNSYFEAMYYNIDTIKEALG